MNLFNKVMLELREFTVWIIKKERVLEFLTLIICFIKSMLIVQALDLVPKERDIVIRMIKNRNAIQRNRAYNITL